MTPIFVSAHAAANEMFEQDQTLEEVTVEIGQLRVLVPKDENQLVKKYIPFFKN